MGHGMAFVRVAARLATLAMLVGVAFCRLVAVAQPILDPAALNQRAVELYHEGKAGEAIPISQRALELREKALPDPRHGF